MNANEYQEAAQRTVMEDREQTLRIVEKIKFEGHKSHLLIAALKLNSESGELADALVKHFCYNQSLDTENIIEECGDLLWYIALILEKLNYKMEDCMADNIAKLSTRYPDKFSDFHAAARLDKATESKKP